jgi:hypothetical protein
MLNLGEHNGLSEGSGVGRPRRTRKADLWQFPPRDNPRFRNAIIETAKNESDQQPQQMTMSEGARWIARTVDRFSEAICIRLTDEALCRCKHATVGIAARSKLGLGTMTKEYALFGDKYGRREKQRA